MKLRHRSAVAAFLAAAWFSVPTHAVQSPQSFLTHKDGRAQEDVPTATPAAPSRDGMGPFEALGVVVATRRVELGVCIGLWCAATMVRNARLRRHKVQSTEDTPPGVLVHELDGMDVCSDDLSFELTAPEVSTCADRDLLLPAPQNRPEQAIVEACDPFMDVPAFEAPKVDVRMTQADMYDFMNDAMMRGGEASESALQERLKVGMYFAVWYALNVFYNIVNKKVLNQLPAPLVVGTAQLGIGSLYVGLVWFLGLRAAPQLTAEGKSKVTQVGLWHSLGQLASSMSLGAGPVSFTHIVKALEPFFSAVVSGVYFSKWMNPQVYATLLPVVGGVGYACLKERSFSWLAFSAAMASNLAFALRAVVSKIALQSGRNAGVNLTPQNMFGVVTWASFLLSIPLALIGEGGEFLSLLSKALDNAENNMKFVGSIVLSGLLHYLNNEVMYLALGSVHPVTLAVSNTMKRVFIMVASVMVFKNPISLQAGIGATIGISGVLLYSLTKQYYESLEAEQTPVEVKTYKSLPKPSKKGVAVTRKR